jgi:uncharacterized protein (TIGR01777 family)
MNVLVTGAGGLIGSALVAELRRGGVQVVRAVRRSATAEEEARWDPVTGMIEGGPPVGAVVHLAGASLERRWTLESKREIERSRIHATHGLCEWLARRPTPPATLVSASAMGFYGDQGDAWLDESSPPGTDWLASVVERWERAADPARAAGIRVVHARFGMVLSPRGGALPPMLRAFRWGLGGRLGSGRQYWSWIALPDAIAFLRRALEDTALSGAVNVVSPQPVPQREFARQLGAALHRPTVLPAPAFALRWLLGGMADAMILSSARVAPRRLREAGFTWGYPELSQALGQALGGSAG